MKNQLITRTLKAIKRFFTQQIYSLTCSIVKIKMNTGKNPEELTQRIVSNSGKSREEVVQLINMKKEKFSGLLTDFEVFCFKAFSITFIAAIRVWNICHSHAKILLKF